MTSIEDAAKSFRREILAAEGDEIKLADAVINLISGVMHPPVPPPPPPGPRDLIRKEYRVQAGQLTIALAKDRISDDEFEKKWAELQAERDRRLAELEAGPPA